MRNIEIIIGQPVHINLFPSSIHEEIAQNIKTILTTPISSTPLDRRFGLDMSFLSNPTPRALMKARVAIFDAIRNYEPRVETSSVEFILNEQILSDGCAIAKIEVKIHD